MLERIATIITAILFFVGLLCGFLIMTIDLIWTFASGHTLTGIDSTYCLVLVIFTPPISLILIYLGQALDYIFKTKRG